MSTRQRPESVNERQTPTDQAVRREVLENDQVLVIETTYPGGSSVPMHTHRFPHVLYVIEGGTAQTTAPDGSVNTLELRSGQALWRDPLRHSIDPGEGLVEQTRNVGSTPMRIVEVEVKNALIGGEKTPRVLTPADLRWIPDTLDPRRTSALLVGDPTRPGPYTMRLRASPGYAIALHKHPAEDENLTILSGTMHWSVGEAGSGAPEHVVPAGSFVLFPAGTPHRIWTTEETMIQMSGIGPRVYVYADPAKDPRLMPRATVDFP